jgi:hypothetical protein
MTNRESVPNDQSPGEPGFGRYIRTSIAAAARSIAGLGSTARLALTVAASILVLLILFWVVDKFVLYFLTRNYVDEVGDVFDLNNHLRNALLLLTFLAALFFARFLWSFSKRKRLIGIAGISALLVGHSLVLWYGTKDITIDRQGNSIKCYVLSRDGKVTYGEHPGIDPATGRQCRPVKPEMVERLKEYEAGKRPQRITESNPTFFDPRSSEPIVWYYRSKDNSVEIFDLMGFNPDTGEELLPITKEIGAEWKRQNAEGQRCVPKLIADPKQYVFFDPRTAEARAWYWRGSNDRYEFYDCPGFQPQTGDKLEVVTREVIALWKDKQSNPTIATKPPNKVEIAKDTVFFDPVSGQSRLWYWRRDKADYDFFDGPGFHPQNGQPLQSFTKEILAQYQQEIGEKAKQLKAEQDRIDAERKANQEADAKKQLEQQQLADKEAKRRAEEAQRQSQAAQQCDELAANPNDSRRVGEGVPYAALKPQAAEAVDACSLAAQQNPNELRFKYQLARALELAGDGASHVKNRQRALDIHTALVKAGYAAAFDNLASLYLWDKKDLATAVPLYRKGVELDDSDSMISLADLVEKNQVMPQSPSETPLELYKRASELGNQNAVRAYQAELEKAQQMQQQRVQQLQQQQMMLQIMGNVLRNIH